MKADCYVVRVERTDGTTMHVEYSTLGAAAETARALTQTHGGAATVLECRELMSYWQKQPSEAPAESQS